MSQKRAESRGIAPGWAKRIVSLIIFSLLAAGLWAVGPPWQMVDAYQLAKWLEDPEPPLIMDVRGRTAYIKETLPGALDAGTNPDGFLPDGRGGAVVLVVPQPPDPELLAAWAKRLRNAAHEVFVLEGGVPAWRQADQVLERPGESFSRPGAVPFVIPRGLCEMNKPAKEYR